MKIEKDQIEVEGHVLRPKDLRLFLADPETNTFSEDTGYWKMRTQGWLFFHERQKWAKRCAELLKKYLETREVVHLVEMRSVFLEEEVPVRLSWVVENILITGGGRCNKPPYEWWGEHKVTYRDLRLIEHLGLAQCTLVVSATGTIHKRWITGFNCGANTYSGVFSLEDAPKIVRACRRCWSDR